MNTELIERVCDKADIIDQNEYSIQIKSNRFGHGFDMRHDDIKLRKISKNNYLIGGITNALNSEIKKVTIDGQTYSREEYKSVIMDLDYMYNNNVINFETHKLNNFSKIGIDEIKITYLDIWYSSLEVYGRKLSGNQYECKDPYAELLTVIAEDIFGEDVYYHIGKNKVQNSYKDIVMGEGAQFYIYSYGWNNSMCIAIPLKYAIAHNVLKEYMSNAFPFLYDNNNKFDRYDEADRIRELIPSKYLKKKLTDIEKVELATNLMMHKLNFNRRYYKKTKSILK